MSIKKKSVYDQSETTYELISLFAGAGGLDIGLESAGFITRAINELEAHACQTLRQNKKLGEMTDTEASVWIEEQISQRCYNKLTSEEKNSLRDTLKKSVRSHAYLQHAEIIEGDIRRVPTNELLSKAKTDKGKICLVAGGPPCQPFSRAGKRETVETEDGRLFLEFVRIVNEARPRWFLFENVKGLAQSKTFVPYLVCNDCGLKKPTPFSLREDVLAEKATAISCPNCKSLATESLIEEIRGGSLEIILNEFESIGYRCFNKILNAADYGVPQSRERLFIVGSRDGEEFEWPIQTHYEKNTRLNSKNGQQLELISNDDSGFRPWMTVRDVLWKNGHSLFGSLDSSSAEIWVKNIVRPHAEPVSWTLDRPSPTVGAHQAAKLAIAPNGVPPEQLARQQWHTKGHRQRDLPPVDVKHAYLSDAELLALQTFPDDWYLYGTRMQRAFQIGNAVPPKLAQVVGQAILKVCKKAGKEV